MTTFALDTSTPSPSLALTRDGATLATLRLGASPQAGRRVMMAAHGLFTAAGVPVADVDRVVVGVGPGAFTGVRVGISTALGLGQALGCDVIGAVSAEAAARGIAAVAPTGAVLVPAADARRGELFAAAYRDAGDGLETLLAPCAIAPDALGERIAALCEAAGAPAVAAGAGAELLAGHLPEGAVVAPPGSPAHSLDAVHLIARVDAGAGVPARPLYARLPDAEVNRRRAREAAR